MSRPLPDQTGWAVERHVLAVQARASCAACGWAKEGTPPEANAGAKQHARSGHRVTVKASTLAAYYQVAQGPRASDDQLLKED